MFLKRVLSHRGVFEDIAKYAMVLWLVMVGTWVYGLRSFAKQQIVSIQNRQMTITLFGDIKDAESGERGYILTRNDAYLPQYVTAVRMARSDMRVLRQYLFDRPSEQKTLDMVSSEINGKLDELERTVTLGKQGQWDQAVSIVKTNDGLTRMGRIRDLFDVLAAQERDVMRRQQAGMF